MESQVLVIGDEEVKRVLANLPSFYFKGAKQILGKAVADAQRETLNNFSSCSAGLSSAKLNSRTGNLARSVKISVSGNDLSSLSANVYTDSIYATIQEKGGTVNSKNKYARVPGGPYLNIPLPANKTAAGVMRYSARDVFGMGGYIAKTRFANWIVFSVDGKPMFVLKRSVKIPARLGMITASVKQAKNIIDNLNNLNLEDI